MQSFEVIAEIPGISVPKLNQSVNQAAVESNSAVAWGQVFDTHFENGQLVITFGPTLLLVCAATVVLFALGRLCWRPSVLSGYEVVEAELELANVGKIRIQPNHDNMQVEHSAWVELSWLAAQVESSVECMRRIRSIFAMGYAVTISNFCRTDQRSVAKP